MENLETKSNIFLPKYEEDVRLCLIDIANIKRDLIGIRETASVYEDLTRIERERALMLEEIERKVVHHEDTIRMTEKVDRKILLQKLYSYISQCILKHAELNVRLLIFSDASDPSRGSTEHLGGAET